MLVSLIKFLLFVAIVAGLVYGAEFLLNQGEGLRIAVANTEFTLGPIQTVIAVVALLVTVWVVLRLLGLLVAVLRFLAGDETAITRFFARNRERRGFKALSEAFTALAAGEGSEAMTKAGKAERLLRRPDLTNLIRAQADAKRFVERHLLVGIMALPELDGRLDLVGIEFNPLSPDLDER